MDRHSQRAKELVIEWFTNADDETRILCGVHIEEVEAALRRAAQEERELLQRDGIIDAAGRAVTTPPAPEEG